MDAGASREPRKILLSTRFCSVLFCDENVESIKNLSCFFSSLDGQT